MGPAAWPAAHRQPLCQRLVLLLWKVASQYPQRAVQLTLRRAAPLVDGLWVVGEQEGRVCGSVGREGRDRDRGGWVGGWGAGGGEGRGYATEGDAEAEAHECRGRKLHSWRTEG